MAGFNFADRYAEAGLSPTAQVVNERQAPAQRIIDDIEGGRILDLVGVYYGSRSLDLSWMRDEFATEDAAFSLVNNEREVGVLAAVILGELVAAGKAIAILGVLTGSVYGRRAPLSSPWLLQDAEREFGVRSVSDRKPATIETKITPTSTPKLGDEISGLMQNDWVSLLALLGRIRSEAQNASKSVATQSTTALAALNRQLRYMREESQMLWWLVGGHSRSLARGFADIGRQQAALVGAADLATLTVVSTLGPVAAPAMLERVVEMAGSDGAEDSRTLASAVDGLAAEDLDRIPVLPEAVPAHLAPVTEAIVLARAMGIGGWHHRFRDRTGLEASIELTAAELAHQLYREHLLGQLL